MDKTPHPAATQHMPGFIPGPDGSDPLMTVTAVILLAAVIAFGVLFLTLHTLPERMAHKSHKLQFEIVAVLGLISLFTHMHIFWIIGLLLALIDLPDFGTPLNRIAGSAEKMAGLQPGEGLVEIPDETIAGVQHADKAAEVPPQTSDGVRHADAPPSPTKPEITLASKRG